MNKIEKGLSQIISEAIRKSRENVRDIGIHSLVEDTVKEAIEFLDSEGVVRKVDRELPDSEAWHKDSREFEAYCAGRNELIGSGYTAWETLI